MGRHADLVMVNSQWTKGHIDEIWQVPQRTLIVYPPCDTSSFEKLPLDWETRRRDRIIVSIAQFRPEKNHELQLDAFSKLIHGEQYKRNGFDEVKLVLIGSCRDNEGDWERLDMLKEKAKQLGIEVNIYTLVIARLSSLTPICGLCVAHTFNRMGWSLR